MFQNPYFIDPPQRSRAGDPLGNGTVIEGLYRTVLPGINNAVEHVRVYSAICWMVRQISETGSQDADADMSELSKRGLDKIQLLLVWYNRHVRGITGLPGGSRDFPQGSEREVLSTETILGKRDADRLADNPDYVPGAGADFMEVVEYRPSLVNGLRFLNTTPLRDVFELTEAGEALADAYEAAIQHHPKAAWLRNLDKVEVSDNEVRKMGDMLDLGAVSEPEIEAFLAQYYPPLDAEIDEADLPNWSQRHQGLSLILRAVATEAPKAKRSEGIYEEVIRFTMARGYTSTGEPLDLTGIEGAQGVWANLQLRQCQRLAQEALFRIVTSWIHGAAMSRNPPKPRDIPDCSQGIAARLGSVLPKGFGSRVGELVETLRAEQGKAPSLYAASHRISETLRLENRREAILTHAKFKHGSEDEDQCLLTSYLALVYCGVEGRNLIENADVDQQLDRSIDRFSLQRLTRLVDEYMDQPPEAFLERIIREHVLLQHFYTVQSRTAHANDEKNRYRFAFGDNGLENVESDSGLFGEVGILTDRLRSALTLLAQCELLEYSLNGRYRLTKKGQKRLAELN